ncbi:hypothetical protein Pmani_005381 [Petrolisthes manimaculis]|uniref:Uncharacterized protein n=1 Tax=Petrolisthes manimaculis TaxID=1843537 RepID=A0AAE1QD18_9EUCA|nr:hypothetical protein Pmani_005381 [Petrolisthes manimaculis]
MSNYVSENDDDDDDNDDDDDEEEEEEKEDEEDNNNDDGDGDDDEALKSVDDFSKVGREEGEELNEGEGAGGRAEGRL